MSPSLPRTALYIKVKQRLPEAAMSEPRSYPSQAQIRLFWVYLRVLAGTEEPETLHQYKRSAVQEYSHGRTQSLRALSDEEISRFLEDYKVLFERKQVRVQAMRNRVVYLFIEKGYCSKIWAQAEAQANEICRRRFKKALRSMYYKELPRIISIIEQRWKLVASVEKAP